MSRGILLEIGGSNARTHCRFEHSSFDIQFGFSRMDGLSKVVKSRIEHVSKAEDATASR